MFPRVVQGFRVASTVWPGQFTHVIANFFFTATFLHIKKSVYIDCTFYFKLVTERERDILK